MTTGNILSGKREGDKKRKIRDRLGPNFKWMQEISYQERERGIERERERER